MVYIIYHQDLALGIGFYINKCTLTNHHSDVKDNPKSK